MTAPIPGVIPFQSSMASPRLRIRSSIGARGRPRHGSKIRGPREWSELVLVPVSLRAFCFLFLFCFSEGHVERSEFPGFFVCLLRGVGVRYLSTHHTLRQTQPTAKPKPKPATHKEARTPWQIRQAWSKLVFPQHSSSASAQVWQAPKTFLNAVHSLAFGILVPELYKASQRSSGSGCSKLQASRAAKLGLSLHFEL